MKNNIVVLVCALALVMFASSTFAQQTTELPAAIAKRTIPGAELGKVMCEDAAGNMVACSGALEETVLGIVTNVPYVTLNKPTTKDGSRFIFESFVSAEAGSINKGDYLVAGSNGNFVRSEDSNMAYAIALDEVASGQKKVRVKVISKK